MGHLKAFLFLFVLLLPREAHVSGSAVGSIIEPYFELRADDGRRVRFSSSLEEARYHRERSAQIARRLTPLADRIRTYTDELRRHEPWAHVLQKVDIEAQDASVRLLTFEQPEYREILRDVQERGAYAYSTFFQHRLDDTRVTVGLRFVFEGSVPLAALYDLEDALHSFRTPMPRDARDAAEAGRVVVHATNCEGHERVLDAIQLELTRRLEERKLSYDGNEAEGTLFAADLEGPGLCRARVELFLAGDHHWGRTKAALLETVSASALGGVSEDPASQSQWKLIVTPPGY
jgi:hypothetical protein